MSKRIGVALGGGGARGLAHIVIIQTLDEMGIKPCVISGTSMGAIVGGFYAAGISGKDMEAMMRALGLKQLRDLVDLDWLSTAGLIRGEGVSKFLESVLPVHTFEGLITPLKVVATDFWNKKPVIFESGDLVTAIRASISIPGIFRPVKLGNRVLCDGGLVNPLPFDIIRSQCEILIAVDVSGTNVPHNRTSMPSIFESISSTFQIMENALVENKMKSTNPDIHVKPRLANMQLLDFHKHAEIMSDAKAVIPEFKRLLENKMRRRGLFSR